MDILEHYDEFVDGTINRTSLAVVVVCKKSFVLLIISLIEKFTSMSNEAEYILAIMIKAFNRFNKRHIAFANIRPLAVDFAISWI